MMRDNSLTESLYTADGVRGIDRCLIGECGVEGYELMHKAARAAFRQLVRHWPDPERILVLCGAGNNGGDGYLVALNALRHGHAVDCVAVVAPDKLSGDARRAWQAAREAGIPIRLWEELSGDRREELLSAPAVIVDAMLGTGAKGKPRAPMDALIDQLNNSGRPVLAIDVPSGLDANTGSVPGSAVVAAVTVTFIGQKTGLYTGQGPHYAGTVEYDALGTESLSDRFPAASVARLATWERQRQTLPTPSRVAHKGAFGHVLVVAGDRGFGGAGLLAAEAASRCGAGLVTLATRQEYVAPALTRCPSMMVRGLTHGNELGPLLEKADVVVCGPGIGQAAWGQQMLQQVLASGLPRVLDADALNLLAKRAPVRSDYQVITPHPGEAARLLGCSTAEVEADRVAAVTSLQQSFGGVALLKGAGTLVASSDSPPVLTRGANPGMATGGMGDVLSGICGALVAPALKSGQSSFAEAVVTSALAHLAAADHASAVRGYRSLLPTDVIDALPAVFREAERSSRWQSERADP